jgi:uncharacterized membrane protein
MSHARFALVRAVVLIAISLPFYGRTWNHFLHDLGAILFLGNLIVTAGWMSLARRSANPEALRLGVRGIVFTDAIFTTPGAILLLLNGGILSAPYFRGASPHWLFVGMGLFAASGIVWGTQVIPTQKKLARAMDTMPAGGPVPPECAGLLARWFRFGGIATAMPLIALVFMVFKPAF